MTTCKICFQSELNKHCPKCQLHSCEKCYKLHLKECSILIEYKYHLCKLHKSQLDGYCCQCCQMTCDLCHYDHAGHDIISTKLAAENIRSHLKEFSRSMHDKEVQLHSLKDIKGIKCCMVNKIEKEERKWLSFVSEIKKSFLSKIEQDLKQHDYELQLHELLNAAKDNLDYLKKNSLTYIFLSKWLQVRSETDLFEKLILQQLERNSRFEKKTNFDFSQIFMRQLVHEFIEEEESELHKLSEQIQHLQTEIKRMQQMIWLQTEEKGYIDKVCMDMVKLTEDIPTDRKFGDITIPKTKNATINTLRQTNELVLNRLIQINNKQIETEKQLKNQCILIANWTENRKIADHDRKEFAKAKDREIQYLQDEKTKLTDLINKLHEEISLKDQKLNDQRVKVQTLKQFIRERLTCVQKNYEEETERTVLKLYKTEVERDKLKQRVENLIDMMTDQKKKENTLQKENESMRNKITDFKIQWNIMTSINSKMSSIVNDGDTISDIEKENDPFKLNLKKLQRDNSKLELEPSITLNKITESRENCQERSRRYVKEGHEMEIIMIVEACSDEETQFSIICHTSEETLAGSTLPCNGLENPHTSLAVSSSKELGYRQISSDKNIVQITANKVYMIERSSVSIESAIDVSNSIEDLNNNHLAIDE